MANTLLALGARAALRSAAARRPALAAPAASMSSYKDVIGKREVVGYGFNGEPNYVDREDFPLPAIRWREPTADIQALREKEKGDWNKLSLEEKKQLYRASFCQTFAEVNAPTGEWKSVFGLGLLFISGAFWLYFGLKTFVYPPLPVTFQKERREAQLRRILDLQINPIEGISSEWDYEKDDWKK